MGHASIIGAIEIVIKHGTNKKKIAWKMMTGNNLAT